MIKRSFALGLSGLLFFAHAALAGGIRVEGAYARAVPPGQPTSAVYLVLTNESDDDLALVGAASDASKVAELHTHLKENGMMKMRRVEKIGIPAGGTTKLRPGGLHIMLIGLKKPLHPGDVVELDLDFDDGSSLSVEAPVKKITLEMLLEEVEEMKRQESR